MNIIELAKKAGFRTGQIHLSIGDPIPFVSPTSNTDCQHELERFAALMLEEAANIAERTPKMSAYDSNMAVQDYIAKKLRTEASALKGAKE